MTEIWEYGDAADEERAERFPWPPGEEDPVLARFGETWRSATFDPARFFARVPRDGGTGAALLYYLALGVLVAGATLFWDALSLYTGTLSQSGLAAQMGLEAVSPVVRFLFAPVALLVTLFVGAAITHMILSLFDGTPHGFGTTIRVFAYAYSPGLFGVVPLIGGIVGSLWMLALLIIGLREAQDTAGWKAAVAVLLPFVLLVALFIVALLTLAAAGAAIMGGA